jgi:hypothetical protein
MPIAWRFVLPLLLLGGGAVTLYFCSRDDAYAILDRAIAAHGGPNSVARANVGRVKMKGIEGIPPAAFTIDVIKEETFHLPGRVRRWEQRVSHLTGQEEKRVAVLKDAKYRQRLNKGEVRVRPATEADEKDLLVIPLRMLLHLREQGAQLTMLEDVEVEGKPAAGIRLLIDGAAQGDLYFDKSTGHLVKWQSHIVIPATKDHLPREMTMERVYADYKTFDGIPLPTKIKTYFDGHKAPHEQYQVTHAEFPEQIDDKIFETLD